MKKAKTILISVFAAIAMLALCCCGSAESGTGTGSGNANRWDVSLENSASGASQSLEATEDGMFSVSQGISEFEYGYSVPELWSARSDYNYPKKGIKVVAGVTGSSVYYNKVVDLKNLDGDIVTFEALKDDSSEISKMEVELIDIYDADKTVKLSWESIDQNTVTYMNVTCNNVSAGRNNEERDRYGQKRGYYGSVNYLSCFGGTITFMGHSAFNMRYDVEENQVISSVMWGEDGADWCVYDVDDPFLMGENVFEGFTTGEVYVKITFTTFTGSGKIILTSVAGNELDVETVGKEPSNYIKVLRDAFDYADEMPVGEKGIAYAVPKADSSDYLFGNLPIGVSLKDPDGNAVRIADNSFVPEQAGTYSLTYTGKDANGFYVKKKFEIVVKEKVDGILLSAEDNLMFTAGTYETLPTVSVTGGSGKVRLETSYLFNGKSISPDLAGKYLFESAGELRVTVKASDYLGKTAEESFAYSVSENVRIVLNAGLPKAFIAGDEVLIPDFDVNVYGGEAYTTKSIEVNGEVLDSSRSFTVPASGTVEVKYAASKNGDAEIRKSFEIPVVARPVTGANADYSKMFIASGSATVSQSEIGIMLTATDDDNRITFINPVSARMTELELNDVNVSAFDYLEVTLTDSVDSNIAVSFRVSNSDYSEYFKVRDQNGSFEFYKYAIPNIAKSDPKHFLYYSDECAVYDYHNVELAKLRYCDNGDVFNGFKSGAFFVSFRFGGVKSASELLLINLGNQPMGVSSLSSGDVIPPELAVGSTLKSGYVTVGEKFVVPKATGVDVLSYRTECTVTFTAPSGKKLLNRAECDEDLVFTLDEIGYYVLSYRVEDAIGNAREWSFNIKAMDFVAPEMTVEWNQKESYAVGEKISLPMISASDDKEKTEDLNVYVLVVNPEYATVRYEIGAEYEFRKAGMYRIMCCVADSSWNYTVKTFEVTVG